MLRLNNQVLAMARPRDYAVKSSDSVKQGNSDQLLLQDAVKALVIPQPVLQYS